MTNLKFNTRIYKKKAIQKAISAYSHFAGFKCVYGKNHIRVKIDCRDPDIKNVIADEFANYVLGVTVKCPRG